MSIAIFLSALFVPTILGDIELTDLQKLEEAFECDPTCWFREEIITYETIGRWPVNCTEVCGIMGFTDTADVPVFDLQYYFQNLKVLKGKIYIIGTQYASVEFLSTLEEIYCGPLKSLSFAGNPNLETFELRNLKNVSCEFSIYDNKRLDVSEFCEKKEGLALMAIDNNFKNCKGCIAGSFYTNQMSKFINCTSIVFGMKFYSFHTVHENPPMDFSEVKDIQNITGGLDLYETDLQNLSFFKSLENIKGSISVFNCLNLTRFAIPSLKSLTTNEPNFLISIENVHEYFCFTTSEMKLFLESNVMFKSLKAMYCEKQTGETACLFESLKNLEANCKEILGDVRINPGDEIYTDKLKNISFIFGSLMIQNTSLADLNFLGSLQYVSSLHNSTIPFQLISNKNLRDANLPNLKTLFEFIHFMIYLLFTLFFVYNQYINCVKELTDYEKIAKAYECDSNCWFREDEVNSTTIIKWPQNCSDVCGKMQFSQTADIPVFELQNYFRNLKVFKGAISFGNTKYASIEFLAPLEEVYCDVLNIFEFRLNANLEMLNFENLTKITCSFYAYNNSRLDATEFCDRFGDLNVMFIYDNFKSCKGCIVQNLYNTELYKYQGCTSIINAMYFYAFWTNYDPPVDMSPLNSIQNISGCLNFYDTDLKNFSFFESLENLRSNQYFDYDINIYQCFNLTRFDMPALKTISTTRTNFIMNVFGVHDDFCFTTSEMHLFLENNVLFDNLHGKYCYNETEESVCIFENISTLESNCTDILGPVLINSGEESYKEKLRNVRNIYGLLIIQGTDLIDLNFLENLEYIAVLNDSTVPLQIISNKQLLSVTLPNLKRVFSKGRYQVNFVDNGSEILNSTACLDLMENLFDTNVIFDGRECEAIDRVRDEENGSVINGFNVWIILLILYVTFI
ncbi:hypothetical protein CRE_08727 [Caenorhabditis remanei]|uniref:Receptor L-domain domain-containing protein n=1 Tax=Caenorhabditis remanei TaxID=31234 RepID=E3LJK7_CAERE|nr:hypothetical protein CRE_08727 [Caenorhabditis remanei]